MIEYIYHVECECGDKRIISFGIGAEKKDRLNCRCGKEYEIKKIEVRDA